MRYTAHPSSQRGPVSPKHRGGGYTLIELIIAVGLFSLVMTLASGAYLVMISLNRQVQGIATGINDLSFALETMTRDIRTGSTYNCGGLGDCPSGASSFSFKNKNGDQVSYSVSSSVLQKTVGTTQSAVTGPSVTISSLTFYVFGSHRVPSDYEQPRVTIIVSGMVSAGPGKTQSFTVETGATMRGSDI